MTRPLLHLPALFCLLALLGLGCAPEEGEGDDADEDDRALDDDDAADDDDTADDDDVADDDDTTVEDADDDDSTVEDADDDDSTPDDHADDDGDGYSIWQGDCDDLDPLIHPGAVETSEDGIDQDCNGFDTTRCYFDQDQDAWGGDIALFETDGEPCHPELTPEGGDCDDADPSTYPGAPELCDLIDGDCDGDLVDGYEDLNHNLVPDCEDLPTDDNDGDGYSPADGDCDDTTAAVHPGATELSNDGIDQDCNGQDTVRCYVDTDGDGFGAIIGYFNGSGSACSAGFTEADGDCDDEDDAAHPGAAEGCDDVDSDCDGDLLDGEPDDDGDGLPDCAAAADDDDSAS